MRDYNRFDILFILKNDNIESHEEILREFWWQEGYKSIEITWEDDLIFNNNDIKVLRSFKEKMRYLFASLHEDTQNKSLICSIIPEVQGIDNVIIGTRRVVNADNLTQWCKKYNFTLEEFLTNRKYIVVSDTFADNIDQFAELGLIDWDNIEYCSAYPDYNGNETEE